MALRHLLDSTNNINILFCVDSKSVLQAIKSTKQNIRLELIHNIKQNIHQLSLQNVNITFCWVPSHCGIYANEKVDQAAKKAARNCEGSFKIDISLDLHECFRLVNKISKDNMYKQLENSNSQYFHHCVKIKNAAVPKMILDTLVNYPRHITSLVYRFRLNALRTKFCKNIKCICENQLSVKHLFVDCPKVKQLFDKTSLKLRLLKKNSFEDILNDFSMLCDISNLLNQSPVGIFL